MTRSIPIFACVALLSTVSAHAASESGRVEDEELQVGSAPSCLDGSGKAADFFYAFKYPHDWQFAYMSKGHKLAKGKGTLDDPSSPISRTLDQLYKSKASLSYVMWNDEVPKGGTASAPIGHAKGVIAFGKTKGFYLTHSVPKFPLHAEKATSSASSYTEEVASKPTYGQSFICITIDKAALKNINTLLNADYLHVYSSADNANLGFLPGTEPDKKADPVQLEIASAGGQDFVAFGKSQTFHEDLYEGLVAPYFGEDLITETWQNGRGAMPSYCKGREYKYTVENSAGVKFPGFDEGQWNEHEDHSKWAVSMSGKVFCVGDINRADAQTKRGGGTICIEDATFAKQMLAVIVGTDEDCKKSSTSELIV